MGRTVNISFSLPVTRADGTDLAIDEIDHVEVGLGPIGGPLESIGSVPAQNGGVQLFAHVLPDGAAGLYEVLLTVVDKQVPPRLSAGVSTTFPIEAGEPGVLAAPGDVTDVDIDVD